jgi:hypothetical protein
MAPEPRLAASPANPQPPLPGAFKLAARQALTLCPARAGLLRVERGSLWVTFDGPHAGPLNDMGDQVLAAGDRLVIRAGQRLVIESWASGAPAYFSWDPMPAPVVERAAVTAQRPSLSGLSYALWRGFGLAARGVRGLAELAKGTPGRQEDMAPACGLTGPR